MYCVQRGFLIVTLVLYGSTFFAAQEGGRVTRSRVAAAAKQKAEHDRQEAEHLYQEAERSRKNALRSSLPCLEELPAYSLDRHIEDWHILIEKARSATHCEAEVICACGVKLSEFQEAWQNKRDAFYAVFKKEVGEGKIEFYDYHKHFVAEHVGIQSLGVFLNPGIAYGLKIVSLEHNNLTSFTEIQEKIIVQCPSLVTLKLDHNRLEGALAFEHGAIREFSATHNNFSSWGDVKVSPLCLIDVRFNSLLKFNAAVKVKEGHYLWTDVGEGIEDIAASLLCMHDNTMHDGEPNMPELCTSTQCNDESTAKIDSAMNLDDASFIDTM
jgi:hypothetical protein